MNVCLIPMMSDFVVNDVAVVEAIADSDFRAGNLAQGAASRSTETAAIGWVDTVGGFLKV